jgi:ATP-dependent DNA helicase RecG
LDKGRQAFIVYPLVEASEKLEEVGAAVEEYERLRALEFANYRVGLLHGRMKPAEKDEIMSAFSNHEIDVLVSTSVVEVGIDVPNASVILIESANRFGLAQLHQFRGRVGRGEHKSFCLLVADATTSEAEQRLKAMEETTDGFKLAEIDWELRGAGDLLGIRQSGLGAFQLAELMNPKLVELAQREARSVFAEDPYLQLPEHRLLAQQIQSLRDQRADVS